MMETRAKESKEQKFIEKHNIKWSIEFSPRVSPSQRISLFTCTIYQIHRMLPSNLISPIYNQSLLTI